jgi:hypothetical protein
VVNSTERCRAAAKVRKVAAKFQALAVIPRLQALFLFGFVSTSEISASLPDAPSSRERIGIGALTQLQSWVEQMNHGEHGGHGEEKGKGLIEERFNTSSDHVRPRDPRVPRGWASF